jgi:hypothetical protein
MMKLKIDDDVSISRLKSKTPPSYTFIHKTFDGTIKEQEESSRA